jgi:hypothetical protein
MSNFFDGHIINLLMGKLRYTHTGCAISIELGERWATTNKSVTCQMCSHNQREINKDIKTEIEITDSISIRR